MKKTSIIITTIIIVIFPMITQAQSNSLKASFDETCRILQEYSFSSDTAVTKSYYNKQWTKYENYKTRSIKLRIEDGFFLFYINDSTRIEYYQSGIYILKLPINGVYFELSTSYSSPHIRIICSNDMNLSHRGISKNITEYKIFGNVASVNALHGSLVVLQKLLNEENFQGVLSHSITPSPKLKTAYGNVIKTLNEYIFRSGDTWYYGDTKSIGFRLQDGFFVFKFVDTGVSYDGSEHNFGRDGTKLVKVPISHAVFYWSDSELYISSSTEDNIEITWRGKKEIEKEYTIFGSKVPIKKLQEELEALLSIAIEENFKGTLGGSSSEPKKTTSQSKSTPQKQAGATQPQPKPRNRIPAGN